MTNPTPAQIEAATAAMRAESDMWNDIPERLNRCASQVLGLTIADGYPDAWLFDGLLDACNGVAATFATRCREGATQAFSMSLALYSVAETYDVVEADNVRRLQSPERVRGHR